MEPSPGLVLLSLFLSCFVHEADSSLQCTSNEIGNEKSSWCDVTKIDCQEEINHKDGTPGQGVVEVSDLEGNQCWASNTTEITWTYKTNVYHGESPLQFLMVIKEKSLNIHDIEICFLVTLPQAANVGLVAIRLPTPRNHPKGTIVANVELTPVADDPEGPGLATGEGLSVDVPIYPPVYCDIKKVCNTWNTQTKIRKRGGVNFDGRCDVRVDVSVKGSEQRINATLELRVDRTAVVRATTCVMKGTEKTCSLFFTDVTEGHYNIRMYPICRRCASCFPALTPFDCAGNQSSPDIIRPRPMPSANMSSLSSRPDWITWVTALTLGVALIATVVVFLVWLKRRKSSQNRRSNTTGDPALNNRQDGAVDSSNGTAIRSGDDCEMALLHEQEEKKVEGNQDEENTKHILLLPPFKTPESVLDAFRNVLTSVEKVKVTSSMDRSVSEQFFRNKYQWLEATVLNRSSFIVFLIFEQPPSIVDPITEFTVEKITMEMRRRLLKACTVVIPPIYNSGQSTAGLTGWDERIAVNDEESFGQFVQLVLQTFSIQSPALTQSDVTWKRIRDFFMILKAQTSNNVRQRNGYS